MLIEDYITHAALTIWRKLTMGLVRHTR